MNLGLVISSMRCGGAERVMAQLANYWASRGRRVTLITLDTIDTDWFPLHPHVKRVALDAASDSRAMGKAIISNVCRVLRLRRALQACGAGEVVSFEESTNVLAVLATRFMRVRLVICERNDPRQNPIRRPWAVLRKWTYPFATALVVQTTALLPWGRQIVRGRVRVSAIPNPVRDMSGYATAQRRPSRRIVAIGRLAAQKGHDVLLQAFARIAAVHPEWNLTIVGGGPEYAALTELAKALGIATRVAFIGIVPEPGEVLASSDIFVMASRHEGFPNALLEAMACGLPVISTNVVPAQEIITDGDDGLLTAVGDAAALSVALDRLICDGALRARLGNSALAVSERYDISAIMPQWDAVLAPHEHT